MKVHDELLDLELEKVRIISIEELAGDRVYNFTVQDNHNYFAENILVHNTDYDEKQVVLAGEIREVLESSGSGNREMESNRVYVLESIDQSLTDLIKITQQDNNLLDTTKEYAVLRLLQSQAIVKQRIEIEKSEFTNSKYNSFLTGEEIRQTTNQILKEIIGGESGQISDFNLLVQTNYGGQKTMQDLLNEKRIMEYLLAGEYAKHRATANPLFWPTYPIIKAGITGIKLSNNGEIPSKWAVANGVISGGSVLVGSIIAGIGTGGFIGSKALGLVTGVVGEAGGPIGALIGAGIAGTTGGLAIITDLLRIKAYKELLGKESKILREVNEKSAGLSELERSLMIEKARRFYRDKKDKLIKLPSSLDYNEMILSKPDFERGNDLTNWFNNTLETIRSTDEMAYLKAKNGTKEQWTLYLELFKTGGSWDLKEYLSPSKVSGAHNTYSYDGIELNQDLFGNFFIGYMTQRSGMRLDSALLGAGIFQISDHLEESIAGTNEKGVNLGLIGSREYNRDDKVDQIIMKGGYELGKRCGDNCSQSEIKEALEKLEFEIRDISKDDFLGVKD